MIVFTLTNTFSGQVYVGTTRESPEQRWAQLCAAANEGLDADLYADIRHCGADVFELKEWAVAEDLAELRQLSDEAIRENDALSLQGIRTRPQPAASGVIRAQRTTPRRANKSAPAPEAAENATSSRPIPGNEGSAPANTKAREKSADKLATGRLSSSAREKKVRDAIEQERQARQAEERARQQQQAAEMAAIMARIDGRARR